MALSAGTRLGPYEILAPLGAGGMGEVYRAKDWKLKRDVAIKVLPESLAANPEALARFEREALAVASLSHPNILSIFDFGTQNGISYAVTELLEGETLRGRLDAGPISRKQAADYAFQIAKGLSAAHEKGIVHRDLKPENLFVSRDGYLKILDFGLAKQMDPEIPGKDTSAPTAAKYTEPGKVMGTVSYMSPEQVRGLSVDHRSDIFSFGAILYELLVGPGHRAFGGASGAETMAAILRDEPPPPEPDGGIGDELWALAEHCLQKDPARRFQSTRDLTFALRPREAGFPEAATARPSEPAAASIAVLPFRNSSLSPDAEYFSDGITEEIINALMKIDALRVAARTSSFAFKGKAEDVRRIGERLGVRTVLEGSVRQAGDKLRVTAQLINVADGYQLWSERYDRSLEDVFAVQDEISRAIASTLEVRLLGSDSGLGPRPGPDPGAYDLFLKGRWYFNQRSASKAVMEFEAAVARDPSFAPAYTGLSDSYGIHAFYGGIDTLVAYEKAREAAGKARALAPDSAEVHLSLGILEHYFGWDFEREERELRRAIARNPRWGPPYYWLGLLFDLRGRPEEGLAQARRAAELEPLSPVAVAAPGWGFYTTGRPDEALREFRKGLEIDPNGVYPLWTVGMAAQCMGEHSEAIAAFEKLVTVTGGSQSHSLGLLGGSYAAAGRRNEAEKVLERLSERSTREYVAPLHRSFVECPLGDFDAAFASLTRACEERNALAWWWICHEPTLARLREDPRFPALRALVIPG